MRRRLSLYTLTGRPAAKQEETTTALGSSQVARTAVELAGRVVQQRDFESGLGRCASRPPACRCARRSGCSSTSASASGLSFLLLLVSGGGILPTVLGLVPRRRPRRGST